MDFARKAKLPRVVLTIYSSGFDVDLFQKGTSAKTFADTCVR